MKCYYCETEFSGNVCPKCMAVYSLTADEAKDEYKTDEDNSCSKRNEEDEKTLVNQKKENEKNKSGKGKKVENIIDAVDILVDIVDSIF